MKSTNLSLRNGSEQLINNWLVFVPGDFYEDFHSKGSCGARGKGRRGMEAAVVHIE